MELLQILKIGKFAYDGLKKLNPRKNAVSGAIKDFFEYSLDPILPENKQSITLALLKWTDSQEFLDFWKQSFLSGLQDPSKAFQSFSSVTGLTHTVGGLPIADALLPHFLRHLEANRIANEPKYGAARQAAFNQPVLEVYKSSLDEPVKVLGRLKEEFFLGEWHSWYTELKLVDDLISREKTFTALNTLTDIRNRTKFAEADKELQFAILEAEGRLALQLNRSDDCIPLLQNALDIAPEDPGTLAALARAYIHKNQLNRARTLAEAALAADQMSPIVIGTYLLVHAHLGDSTKVFSEFPEHPEWWDMPEVLSVLGHTAAMDNDFDLAITYYKSALDLEPDDNGLAFNIACCKLIKLQQDHTGYLTFEAQSARPSSEAITSLVAELESLLETTRNLDYPEPATTYVHALIAVYQLADNYPSALEAIQRWAPDVANTALQIAMVLVYLHLDKIVEAESILSRYDEIAGQNFDVCRYELAMAKGDLTTALKILDRLEQHQEAETTKIATLGKRAWILIVLGRMDESVVVIDQLIERHGTIEIAVIEAAVLYKLTNQNLKHEHLMRSELISDEGLISIHRGITSFYYEQEKWLLAATELRNLPNIDDSESDLIMLVDIQQRAGLHHAAGFTARKVRLLRGNVGNGALAEIELRDYSGRGDYRSAVDLLAYLRESAPKNTDYICCEAVIQIRWLKNKPAAEALLAGITLNDISDSWRVELRRVGLINSN
jgi:tetratricopeptide (TPR) repeat protein